MPGTDSAYGATSAMQCLVLTQRMAVTEEEIDQLKNPPPLEEESEEEEQESDSDEAPVESSEAYTSPVFFCPRPYAVPPLLILPSYASLCARFAFAPYAFAVQRPVSAAGREIHYKKPLFWLKLYRDCGFLCLISAQCVQCPRLTLSLSEMTRFCQGEEEVSDEDLPVKKSKKGTFQFSGSEGRGSRVARV
eukprot:3771117-Rhodomonas_salina.1